MHQSCRSILFDHILIPINNKLLKKKTKSRRRRWRRRKKENENRETKKPLGTFYVSRAQTHTCCIPYSHIHFVQMLISSTNVLQCFSKCLFISTLWMWKLSPFCFCWQQLHNKLCTFCIDGGSISAKFPTISFERRKSRKKVSRKNCICMYVYKHILWPNEIIN